MGDERLEAPEYIYIYIYVYVLDLDLVCRLRVATRLEEEMEHDLWSVVEVSVFGFTETNPYPARKFSKNTGVKGARQQPRRH